MERFSYQKVIFWTAFVVILILILSSAGILRPVEDKLYDLEMIGRALINPADTSVLVISVDERTLDRMGPWPLSRTYYAQLIRKLEEYQVAGIGIDILLADRFEEVEDNNLKEALQGFPGAVLARVLHLKMVKGLGWEKYILEDSEEALPFKQAQLYNGFINLFPDSDGVIRRARTRLELAGREYYSLPLQLLRHSGMAVEIDQVPENFLIDYAPLYTIPVLSLVDVLAGEYPASLFKDKVVIIGATAKSLEDYVATPLIQLGLQPGVLVQATILNNLLQRRYIESWQWLDIFLLVLISFLTSALFMRFIPSRRWLWSLLIIISLVTAGVFHFISAGLWVKWGRLLIATFCLVVITSIVHFKEEQDKTARLEQLFSRYVSRELLSKILINTDEEALLVSKREVTIVFIDIRNFTDYAAGKEPEEVLQVVNKYMDIMVREVFAQGGMVNKFLGDGLMAIFGAPIYQEGHVRRAVDAASRIMARAAQEELPLKLGIGINSGLVVAGNVGTRDRLEYTVIGEPVNTAARLCESALPEEILLGESTSQALPETEGYERISVTRNGLTPERRVYHLDFKRGEEG
ncbi:MAG: adenylate/guanylate cyclase domain-containing protein [Halanaerobium sp.]|nr:adenylate/guanylate cyclase domain-containing protein [Halanaerobium sp.]